MGIYINPVNGQTKEAFLGEQGLFLGPFPPKDTHFINENEVIVCLVHNGAFTAAAVCNSISEFDVFADPHDIRPKLWFAIERSRIRDHVGGAKI